MRTKPDFGVWEELLIIAGAHQCVPLGVLHIQAAEDSMAVQLQEDGNGFFNGWGPPHSSVCAEFILSFVKF